MTLTASMLRLAFLLDHGARALRHLAERWDDKLQGRVDGVASDPLGVFLLECRELAHHQFLNLFDRFIRKIGVYLGKTARKVAKRLGHEFEAPFEDRPLIISARHMYLAYRAWCDHRQQILLAQSTQMFPEADRA